MVTNVAKVVECEPEDGGDGSSYKGQLLVSHVQCRSVPFPVRSEAGMAKQNMLCIHLHDKSTEEIKGVHMYSYVLSLLLLA